MLSSGSGARVWRDLPIGIVGSVIDQLVGLTLSDDSSSAEAVKVLLQSEATTFVLDNFSTEFKE